METLPAPTLTLSRATPDDLPRIENLMQFYNYDLSEWTPVPFAPEGRYQLRPKAPYWAQPDVHPFMIQVDGDLAGFAVVDAECEHPDSDHNMGYFFLARGYRGHGLAARAAGEVLSRFPGRWEVYHLMANTPALQFWPGVIRAHATGDIGRELRTLHEDDCCLYRFTVAAP
ncbi:MAG: GNAT family N-acetyltransferase [Mitsuaria chitosanitabida]|jgi:predicted acetyltransferase|uniref:GNAT family N-acetyltransferase n=1 Tax=Roseateles chitosanitabidus TaxID=65048 RepID=UPI001B0B0590|nr:GNAT family N-acetyltransferase [Roseateles chitosanitabidus]MBO9688921.1 GNAT family N-acetyltransferase [Roseateles chitosanitabidus]